MKNPKMSLKSPEFIRDSVKQIKKYGYRVKKTVHICDFVRQSQDF
jgi:hypothetical protein